ncbi:response regulator [Olivibacter sp. SDN3]|uniref:LytR/AlgR family response regulator transcription factor n=1 Tax=Olivibacter sp. SDN3 TaxID=2764720 RepID=UPI0016511E26|nr:response regulator [Olivibacter sp. SDN3]QNL50988.1 response regulator [Olivibacter sp. SDN3]
MIKTIIIDDEPLARKRLRTLLEDFSDKIALIAEASNGKDALALMERLHPDLIFLDIEMPAMNGFEMLRQLKTKPAVVFITAYDQFAIKAFEENALDYLMKPVEKDRLCKTIVRVEQDLHASFDIIQRFLEGALIKPKKEISSISIKVGDRIIFIKTADIVFIVAEEKYVFLYDTKGNKHLTDYTLQRLEEKLPNDFLRIHRGSIINRHYIKEIRKGFNGSFTFVMANPEASRLKSSRGYQEAIRMQLDL